MLNISVLDQNSPKESSDDLKSQENVQASPAHKSGSRVESEVDGPKEGITYMKDSLLNLFNRK